MEQGIVYYSRFLQGEKQAFEEIVALYSDALTRFSYGFLKDVHAAEDVMMDVFASLIVKKRRFKQESAFKTYLFKAARNKCINYLRANKRHVPLDEAETVLTEPTFEGMVADKERKARLFAAMQKLPLQYRDALCLVYLEEFSIEQARQVLGKSKKQIYNLLSRAKTSLGKILSEEDFDYEL